MSHRPQEQTRQTILQTIAHADAPLTRKQIVTALGRAKSPHLLDLIESLVEEGYLERTVYTLHNGVQGYAYKLAPGVTIE